MRGAGREQVSIGADRGGERRLPSFARGLVCGRWLLPRSRWGPVRRRAGPLGPRGARSLSLRAGCLLYAARQSIILWGRVPPDGQFDPPEDQAKVQFVPHSQWIRVPSCHNLVSVAHADDRSMMAVWQVLLRDFFFISISLPLSFLNNVGVRGRVTNGIQVESLGRSIGSGCLSL